jgi:hypothetical protein
MVLIQMLLPTTGAAGRQATTALAETRRELVDKFSGVTAYVRSPAKGLWAAPDGHTEADDVVMVEVVTASFDRRWWRAYAATLAQRFRQDTIHVRALPVEMLDEPAGNESSVSATLPRWRCCRHSPRRDGTRGSSRSGDEGLQDVRIVEALYKSARTQRPVAIPRSRSVSGRHPGSNALDQG